MRKKFWIITTISAIAVIFFILLFYSYIYDRLALVEKGLASSKFPYLKYSQDELNKMYPQYIENNAPTVQSPEETHRKFVEALKKQDFDEAVKCCFRQGDWGDIKDFLVRVKTTGQMSVMIEDLQRDFVKESIDNNKAVYSFASLKDGQKFGHFLNFIKNSQGVWLIESL